VTTHRASRYVLPPELTAAQARQFLEQHLDLEWDARELVDRAYYDTFDGLVRVAGMTLVCEGDRLVLRDGEDRERAAVDWSSDGVPVQAADLPPGAMRDLLARVIDVRAATVLVRVRVRRQVLRVLDGERKTVARIDIEEPALTDHRRVALNGRISVVGVRGYDKALRRVERVVEDELGLRAAVLSLADEAVVGAGGTPGGVSSKLDVALDPAQRADGAAVALLSQLLTAIEVNLPGTLADVDTEFLHDLRVAVRRTRALQREFKTVFPPAELAHFRAEFRRLQAITGPSRDLDVYVLEFDEFAGSLPEAQRRDLEPLHALLIERRRRERRRMVRALRSPRTATVLSQWERFVAGLELLPDDGRPDAKRGVAALAGERIAAVYGHMVRMGKAIGDDSPPAALHELRKKGKELRYLLEFFSGLYPAATVDPMIKTLKSLQDTLGRFQDREVQAVMLRAVGDEVATLDDGAQALMAMGMLVERLERQQAQARSEFAERFAGFAGKSRRAAVKRTFR